MLNVDPQYGWLCDDCRRVRVSPFCPYCGARAPVSAEAIGVSPSTPEDDDGEDTICALALIAQEMLAKARRAEKTAETWELGHARGKNYWSAEEAKQQGHSQAENFRRSAAKFRSQYATVKTVVDALATLKAEYDEKQARGNLAPLSN